MSKVNDYGFSEDNSQDVGISINTPFLESEPISSSNISGKIGSNSNNNNRNSIGSGNISNVNNNSGGGININDNSGFMNESNNNSGVGNLISTVRSLTHPVAATVHVLFKVSSILYYLFSSLFFGGGFILTFIICILLLSFDFWTVKNVTGRLLVGLRWWNQVSQDDGTNKWYFETAPEGHRNNQIESLVFWISLYISPLIWFLFFLKSLISFQFAWILIPIIALSLNIANLYGFYKCSNHNVTNVATTFATNYIGKSLLQRALEFKMFK